MLITKSLSLKTHNLGKIAVLSACFLLATTNAQAQVIIDGEGFESPAYSTTFDGDGKLDGQVASLPGDGVTAPWKASLGTTSTAVVQDSIFLTGSQAVQLDRAANEPAGGGRWGVPVTAWPDSARYVCIEWDMRVEDSMGAMGAFGPFFGVEAYDDAGVGSTKGLMGSLGVDSTTGDVLYQATGTGFLAETGSSVTFGDWNHFRIDLDFDLHEYSVVLNGTTLLTEAFVDGVELNDFTDAPLATFAAGGDMVSQGLTGTAYFDNYSVFQTDRKIPEPSTLVLALGALLALPYLRSRKR